MSWRRKITCGKCPKALSYGQTKRRRKMGQKRRSVVGWSGIFRSIVGEARCWYVKSVKDDGARKQGTWLRGRDDRVLREATIWRARAPPRVGRTVYCTTQPTSTRNRGAWPTGIVGNRSRLHTCYYLLPVTWMPGAGRAVLDGASTWNVLYPSAMQAMYSSVCVCVLIRAKGRGLGA